MKSDTRPLELERWEWEQLKAVVKAAREVVTSFPGNYIVNVVKLRDALAAWDENKERRSEDAFSDAEGFPRMSDAPKRRLPEGIPPVTRKELRAEVEVLRAEAASLKTSLDRALKALAEINALRNRDCIREGCTCPFDAAYFAVQEISKAAGKLTVKPAG